MSFGEAPVCTFFMRLSKSPHLPSLHLTTSLLTELYLHFNYKRHNFFLNICINIFVNDVPTEQTKQTKQNRKRSTAQANLKCTITK